MFSECQLSTHNSTFLRCTLPLCKECGLRDYTLTSTPSHLHTYAHRVWETVFFKKAEGSLGDNVPSFFNISVCGSVPPQQHSQCSASSICYSEHLDKFYSLGTVASCDVSYANRQVQFQFEYSQSAANIFGHGNVTVTLVCGRNLVSLLTVLCIALHKFVNSVT